MIRKFAQFWLENAKVTIVLILITVFTGIGSYIFIPKQYTTLNIPCEIYDGL